MVVGILGGGQLGRMLALAAADIGLSAHVYCPDPRSPAFAVSAARTIAPYDDEAAIEAFAEAVDVVTFEFENIPAEALRLLTDRTTVLPESRSLEMTSDRLVEKAFVSELGIPVAPFAEVNQQSDIYSALARTGRPAILKTRRFGYDGKGQVMIRAGDDPVAAWRAIGEKPSVLEGFVPFGCEISVVIARGRDGATRTFDIGENVHRNGILHTTTVPATVPEGVADEAVAMAEKIAAALDHVGVLAVEMFVSSGDRPSLMVNEIAPRVHNSGHWTTDGAICSQFEQHIRAICGWPLGGTERHSNLVMTNLIGDSVNEWPGLAGDPRARVHLYGKAETRPGRKMGHVNRITGPATGPGRLL